MKATLTLAKLKATSRFFDILKVKKTFTGCARFCSLRFSFSFCMKMTGETIGNVYSGHCGLLLWTVDNTDFLICISAQCHFEIIQPASNFFIFWVQTFTKCKTVESDTFFSFCSVCFSFCMKMTEETRGHVYLGCCGCCFEQLITQMSLWDFTTWVQFFRYFESKPLLSVKL